MLKYSTAELEIISDPEKHYMIERAMRGGLSFAKLRHAKVQDDSEHILLLDVNNQYGKDKQQRNNIFYNNNNIFFFIFYRWCYVSTITTQRFSVGARGTT